jgi:hypothetical protein
MSKVDLLVFSKTTPWFFPTRTFGVRSVLLDHLKLLFIFLSDVKYCCYKNVVNIGDGSRMRDFSACIFSKKNGGIFLLSSVNTGSGARPTSYQMGLGTVSPGYIGGCVKLVTSIDGRD